MPDATVVIPARDAAASLPRALAALGAQTLARDRFEVVVADDGSRDDTAAIAAEHPVVDRVVRLPDGGAAAGPGAARNAAAAHARAPVLAFTDADCMPEPAWLERVLAALLDRDLVQGRVVPDRPPGPYERTVRVEAFAGLFETANLAIRRALFEDLGGFTAGWRPGGGKELGEDVLLGWRARRAGARVAFAEDAVVRHAVMPRSAAGFIAERTRLTAFPAIVGAVPELRATLCWHRRFLTARGAAFDAALAGLAAALATRRAAPLALALPYARHVAQDARPALPAIAADAVGAAALVAGSVRARSLLL